MPEIRGFNGATSFQKWKFIPGALPPRLLERFNGATSFQTWKCKQWCPTCGGKNGFNWGHVFSDVEMNELFAMARRVVELQWGHVFSDVEI